MYVLCVCTRVHVLIVNTSKHILIQLSEQLTSLKSYRVLCTCLKPEKHVRLKKKKKNK